MADVKKFTGYTASDGTHHDSFKKASDHTVLVKIKEALKAKFASPTPANHGSSVSQDDRDNFVIYPESVVDFLFDNRAAILEALTQSVTKRAPRKPRVAAAKSSNETQTPA